MEGLRDAVLPPTIYGERAPPMEKAGSQLMKGVATSGGYHQGPARVVKGLADLGKVGPGDVLVIPYSERRSRRSSLGWGGGFRGRRDVVPFVHNRQGVRHSGRGIGARGHGHRGWGTAVGGRIQRRGASGSRTGLNGIGRCRGSSRRPGRPPGAGPIPVMAEHVPRPLQDPLRIGPDQATSPSHRDRLRSLCGIPQGHTGHMEYARFLLDLCWNR